MEGENLLGSGRDFGRGEREELIEGGETECGERRSGWLDVGRDSVGSGIFLFLFLKKEIHVGKKVEEKIYGYWEINNA